VPVARLVWNDDRFTEDSPISAKFVPEEERWNMGWLGRDRARDCLDPDMDLAWLLENVAPALELDRFIAEAGSGMPVL
jgi:hypothetical protein